MSSAPDSKGDESGSRRKRLDKFSIDWRWRLNVGDAEKTVRVGTRGCLVRGSSGNQWTSGWEALGCPAAGPARLAWSNVRTP
jgi:hypothetical protein